VRESRTRVAIVICRLVYANSWLFPHTCTRCVARVSRQDRNASSGRVREEKSTCASAGISRILEKERRTHAKEEDGGRHVTPVRSSAESSQPPTWPIQGEIYPSALPATSCIGTFLILPLPIYQESPHCYFPFPRTRLPVCPPPTHSSPTRTGHVSQAFPRDEFVSAKVTGEIFRATVTWNLLLLKTR